MADPVTVEAGATATIQLAYVSQFDVASPPAPGATATSDQPGIATVALSADFSTVEIAGIAPGSAVVSLAMNDGTDATPVTVVAPVAKRVRMLTATATFRRTGG